ncbi:MAG: TerB family tellurite resistance protein, partial [Planktomarina sp.]
LFERDSSYKTPIPDADPNHAFGALLVRVAKSDHNYQVAELQKIDKVLAAHLNVNAIEAAKFRAECEHLERAMPDTASLGAILATSISASDREAMFVALWDVLMADGVRHADEVAVLAQVRSIFTITRERAVEITGG